MGEYKDMKTGARVETGDKFKFPATGAKVLIKERPPIATEVGTD